MKRIRIYRNDPDSPNGRMEVGSAFSLKNAMAKCRHYSRSEDRTATISLGVLGPMSDQMGFRGPGDWVYVMRVEAEAIDEENSKSSRYPR